MFSLPKAFALLSGLCIAYNCAPAEPEDFSSEHSDTTTDSSCAVADTLKANGWTFMEGLQAPVAGTPLQASFDVESNMNYVVDFYLPFGESGGPSVDARGERHDYVFAFSAKEEGFPSGNYWHTWTQPDVQVYQSNALCPATNSMDNTIDLDMHGSALRLDPTGALGMGLGGTELPTDAERYRMVFNFGETRIVSTKLCMVDIVSSDENPMTYERIQAAFEGTQCHEEQIGDNPDYPWPEQYPTD